MGASEPEFFSDLVGTFYDAALNPDQWIDALESARGYVGGQVASLYWHDSVRPIGNNYFQVGIAPEWSDPISRRT